MSSVVLNLQKEIADSLKAGEKDKLETLRMILAVAKKSEIDSGTAVDESGFIMIIEKMIKQRKESISFYDKAGRDELAKKEQSEIEFLQTYLPKPLTKDEINSEINNAITETAATSIKDMGRVMAIIKNKLAGRADMAEVSQCVRDLLSA